CPLPLECSPAGTGRPVILAGRRRRGGVAPDTLALSGWRGRPEAQTRRSFHLGQVEDQARGAGQPRPRLLEVAAPSVRWGRPAPGLGGEVNSVGEGGWFPTPLGADAGEAGRQPKTIPSAASEGVGSGRRRIRKALKIPTRPARRGTS